ncbi:translation factor GUF1 homolog, mitochondrial [Neodiprion pinetum]|uniref:translation factor GUF1 homolog, mitochondrial n=1 Tax=Neodiprion pinetum TaxID=441929 RepID=UPI001EDE0022|nr:translation factor GUF1 homolog, mitochondrial [Neodiprion pinetum]
MLGYVTDEVLIFVDEMIITNTIRSVLNIRSNCLHRYVEVFCKRIRQLPATFHETCYSTGTDELESFETPIEAIRNFSIIAHVDHGKSTLADRLLEKTGAIQRNAGAQFLDKLQVEKERGITVKAQSASLNYKHKGTNHLLNLIDTPGHVDFSNEVARSLAACQGVILLVDANHGVQAQTVANFYLAFAQDLTVIPVLNKVDLKNADPERVIGQLNTLFDIEAKDVLKISAKLGTGVDELLEAIVERVPPPSVNRSGPLKALIFDSWFDKWKGAISLVYINEGSVSVGDQISSIHTGNSYEVKNLFLLTPFEKNIKTLFAGQIGCIACNMKSTKEAYVGDTLHLKEFPVEALKKFEPARPMVFAGVYPMDQSQHVPLRSAIDKLVLNDYAVTTEVDSSPALGLGWRLGFLGLLHMEVFIQRLEQEYGTLPLVTAPNVTYKAKVIGAKNITKYKSDEVVFNNPSKFPPQSVVSEYYEPIVLGTIITPDEYLSPVMSLCMEKRGIHKSGSNIDGRRVLLQFDLPLNEIVMDFHDSLKSISSGYASFDYENLRYEPASLVKLDILLNGVLVEELSTIAHYLKATAIAKKMVTKLQDIIPRQQYLIAIQAAVGSKILARENIKPYRKDVTAKLYGGDITRRKKLLAQQAEGKRRMRMIGNISLPRETFIEFLKK